MLASNFSTGVAVLNYIVEFAASVLNESFDAGDFGNSPSP